MSVARAVSASCAVLMVLTATRAMGGLTEEQQEAYRDIRKGFFLVMPLNPYRKNRLRKEIRQYGSRVAEFIKATGDSSPKHQSVGYYYRARLYIKLKQFDKAREDFDLCLQRMLGPGKAPEGTPTEGAVRVWRAFTFVDEGSEAILAELEAIPAGTEKPRYHEVGSLVTNWADALANADMNEAALKAYEFVKRNELWDEEADDPRRKIDLLKIKQEQTTNDAETGTP